MIKKLNFFYNIREVTLECLVLYYISWDMFILLLILLDNMIDLYV